MKRAGASRSFDPYPKPGSRYIHASARVDDFVAIGLRRLCRRRDDESLGSSSHTLYTRDLMNMLRRTKVVTDPSDVLSANGSLEMCLSNP